MINRKRHIILVIFLTIHTLTFGQDRGLSEMIHNIAEELAAEEAQTGTAELYIEQLQELYDNPVVINSGDEDEISRLFFLSDFQIMSLAGYVRSTGKIVSVYELGVIPGFNREIAEMTIPFITLETRTRKVKDDTRIHNSFLTNLVIRPGDKDTSDLGSPLKILSKYNLSAGPFSAGFTAEKDAGERYLEGNPPLPDLLCGYLSYSGKGFIKSIVIGDYSLRFGQGTSINTGMRTAISLTAPGLLSGRDFLKPYTSTDENNFFRGAAFQFTHKKIGGSVFFSQNRIDASVITSPDSSSSYAVSLYRSGLHNTPSLLQKKDAMMVSAYGFNLTSGFRTLKTGILFTATNLSLALEKGANDPEYVNQFRDSENHVLSFYYNKLISNTLIYGDLSYDLKKSLAFIQGLSIKPSARLAVNFQFREYDPGYMAFHGNGPGSGSVTAAERALMGSFTFEAARHIFIYGGADIADNRWLKYRCSFPSRSARTEIRLKYLPGDKLNADLSYGTRFSMIDINKDQGAAGIQEIESSVFKGLLRYNPSHNLSLSARISYKVSSNTGSRGILLAHDIYFTMNKLPLSLWMRYCIFKTGDWDSRLYIYENDLLYSFSVPALSGEGTRSYIMAKWDIGDKAELRFKYSLTSLTEKNIIQEQRDEIKLQLRVFL